MKRLIIITSIISLILIFTGLFSKNLAIDFEIFNLIIDFNITSFLIKNMLKEMLDLVKKYIGSVVP